MQLRRHTLVTLIVTIASTFGTEQDEEDSSMNDCDFPLDLTGIGLKSLPNGFTKNELLTRFILDDNEISEIPSTVLSSMPRLTHLSLSNNKFQSLDLSPFSNLLNLETLILTGNCKAIITPGRQHYEYDSWSRYQQLIIEPEVKKFCSLHLDTDLLTLKNLNLENNNLENLKLITGSLPALAHLYLSHNEPIKFDAETAQILSNQAPALTHLYLRNCKMTELNLLPLKTVTSLYLDFNSFRSICNANNYATDPLVLKNLTNLRTLSVSNNGILDLETDAFQSVKNLTSLDLSYNFISEIKRGTFDKLYELRDLSLAYNKIVKLSPVHSFKDLINLENLMLGGNNLSDINGGLFANLRSLKTLHLNSTQISHLDPNTFAKLSKLESLSLANNKLSVIPHGAMPVSGSLVTLNLDNNKFTDTVNIPLNNTPNMVSLSLKKNPLTTITSRWLSQASEDLVISIG